jgi:hypothetical protein
MLLIKLSISFKGVFGSYPPPVVAIDPAVSLDVRPTWRDILNWLLSKVAALSRL